MKIAVVVRNEFTTIVDGSPYALDPTNGSDSSLYALIGWPIYLHAMSPLIH
jgi:hypothetical protein